MRARATAPRAPANRNDLSEDKRLDPEQSVISAIPRRSGQATNLSLARAIEGIRILIGLCSLVQPNVGFPPCPM